MFEAARPSVITEEFSGTEVPASGPSMITSSVGVGAVSEGAAADGVGAETGNGWADADTANASFDLRTSRSLRLRARDLRGLNAATSRYSERVMNHTNSHNRMRNAYFSTAKVSSVIMEKSRYAHLWSCEEAQYRMRVRPIVIVLPSSSVAAGT